MERQELEAELVEAEVWGASRTGALLREDAKERRQRRLRLGPYGETRKTSASSAWTDQQPQAAGRDRRVHWESRHADV
eukprot:COSAG06_NODE_26186_length_620_cov_0.690979_2_plen_77_part_01